MAEEKQVMSDKAMDLFGRVKDQMLTKRSDGYQPDGIIMTQDDYDTFREHFGLSTKQKESRWTLKLFNLPVRVSSNAVSTYVSIDEKAEVKPLKIGR